MSLVNFLNKKGIGQMLFGKKIYTKVSFNTAEAIL